MQDSLLKASTHALMSFCRCSAGVELEANEAGVSTMTPAAFPTVKQRLKIKRTVFRCNIPTFWVQVEPIVDVLAKIAN